VEEKDAEENLGSRQKNVHGGQEHITRLYPGKVNMQIREASATARGLLPTDNI